MAMKKKKLSAGETKSFLEDLRKRFENNPARHKGIKWADVQARLESKPEKLWSLNEMEITGGEPDVVGYDKKTGEFIFYDCSAESPTGRRSLCFDEEAWKSRKENKPKGSALGVAEDMGIQILNESQYRELQTLGTFDTKTSSWIETPASVRKLGGALFCDFRFGMVFTYHNGAESYYAARGFRGMLRV